MVTVVQLVAAGLIILGKANLSVSAQIQRIFDIFLIPLLIVVQKLANAR